MAEKTERRIDSWKTKRKYKIIAPENFENKELGLLISSDPKKLIGRKVVFSLRDLNGDRQKQHLNIILKINDVEGDRAKTVFDSFEVNKKYLISKVHTGSDVIDHVENVEIKDYKVKIKTMVTTTNKVHRSMRRDIVKTISEVLKGYKNTNLNEFIEMVLFGKINMEIFRRAKKICPMGRVEIRSLKPLEALPFKPEVQPEPQPASISVIPVVPAVSEQPTTEVSSEQPPEQQS